MTVSVGDRINFSFPAGKASLGVAINGYASGIVLNIGKRISIKVETVTDNYCHQSHIGTIKHLSPDRIIPDLVDKRKREKLCWPTTDSVTL